MNRIRKILIVLWLGWAALLAIAITDPRFLEEVGSLSLLAGFILLLLYSFKELE